MHCRAKKSGVPSYISPEAFIGATLDLLIPAKAGKVRTIADIAGALSGAALATNPKLKESLTALLDAADDDLDQFKTNLATWFNQGMDRVTGWYKRYTQQMLFALGLILAIGCNVDTIHIVRTLSSDPKTLQAIVHQAVETVEKGKGANDEGASDSQLKTTIESSLDRAIQNVNDSLATLNGLSIPIGWSPAQLKYFDSSGAFIGAVFGYLLTALAASLGGPFWFDLLNRLVNIRGNDRSPVEPEPKAKS